MCEQDAANEFLSTPSARRATRRSRSPWHNPRYFYPRPPRGGRPPSPALPATWTYFYPRPPRGGRREYYSTEFSNRKISIHALREEGDDELRTLRGLSMTFLSTPSARRATQTARTGGTARNFYPRPPRGGRLRFSFRWSMLAKFLSTPSARRATGEAAAVQYSS